MYLWMINECVYMWRELSVNVHEAQSRLERYRCMKLAGVSRTTTGSDVGCAVKARLSAWQNSFMIDQKYERQIIQWIIKKTLFLL